MGVFSTGVPAALFDVALEPLEQLAHSGAVAASDGEGVEDPSDRAVLEGVGGADGHLGASVLVGCR